MKEILITILTALLIHFFPDKAQELFQVLTIATLILIFFELGHIEKNTRKS